MNKKSSKEKKSVTERTKKYKSPMTTTKDMIMLAKIVIKKLDIKMYKTQLYFRQDNKYIHNNRLLLQSINELCELTRFHDTEVLHQINYRGRIYSNWYAYI